VPLKVASQTVRQLGEYNIACGETVWLAAKSQIDGNADDYFTSIAV